MNYIVRDIREESEKRPEGSNRVKRVSDGRNEN